VDLTKYFVFLLTLFFPFYVISIPSQEGMPISYAEWNEVYKNRRCPEDFVVLSDGSKLCGVLEKLPPLEYSFGILEFKPADIAAISLFTHEGRNKIQYIRRDGQNFIGQLAKGKFTLWINEPTAKDPNHQIKKEIDPKIVSFILLKERERYPEGMSSRLSSFELKNGDELPGIIRSDSITLSDGWSEKSLNPADIIELNFNGGLHGQILESGEPVDLGFMFVKERFLTVQLSYPDQTVRIPWDQIEGVQTKNGGFKKSAQPSSPILFVRSSIQDVDEALQSGIQTTAPDCIGNNRGTLLTSALGGIPIKPAALLGLAELGQEKLMATKIKSLFNNEEEQYWNLGITLEEEPVQLYQHLVENSHFDSVGQSQIEASRSERGSSSRGGKGDEEDQFGEAVASQNRNFQLTPAALAKIEEILFEEEEEEPIRQMALTPKALAIIEEILSDEELDEPHFVQYAKLDEPVEFPLPVKTEDFPIVVEAEESELEDSVPVFVQQDEEQAEPLDLATDLFWDELDVDISLTHEEMAMLDELFED
jgi:hypothetical protein